VGNSSDLYEIAHAGFGDYREMDVRIARVVCHSFARHGEIAAFERAIVRLDYFDYAAAAFAFKNIKSIVLHFFSPYLCISAAVLFAMSFAI
jgi:hypothetical protein